MKTSELNGSALDWAVAKIVFPEPDYEDDDRLVYVHGDDEFHFTPSTDWSQGGPIIERECIGVTPTGTTREPWVAEGAEHTYAQGIVTATNRQTGETPLIAAMRCYVSSKLGDEVEIPGELM